MKSSWRSRRWSRLTATAIVAAALAIAPSAFAATTPTPIKTPPSTPKPSAAKLDINGASKASLARLAGVGTENAEKIIAGRPYKSTAELESRKILSKELYDTIAPLIVVHPK